MTVEIVGAAASIASIVALSGRELVMGEGSYFMIHNPWAAVMGDAEELLRIAEVLEKMRGEMANIYSAHSHLDRDDVLAKMTAETWYTAEEAVEAGFAASVKDYGEMAARTYDLSRYSYRQVPERLRAAEVLEAEALAAEADPASGGSITQEGDAMKLSEVVEYLGSATAEDKDAIAKAIGLTDAQAQLVAMRSQIATLEEAVATYKTQAEARAKAELALRKAAAIEAALTEGRILPKDRAKWEARFDEQPAFVEGVLADLPKAVDYSTVGHGQGGGEGDLSAEDVQAMKAMHMNEADYRKFLAAHKAAEQAAE